MNIVVLGAAGRTGKEVVAQALAAGHTVTAFIRSSEVLNERPELTVVVGDARSKKDLSGAFVGQDVVISTLGSSKPNDDLMLRAVAASIDAANAAHVRRFILLSSFLAAPHKRSGLANLIRPFMKGMLDDKSASEKLLADSDLDWTIVYATALDRAPKGGRVRIVGPEETIGATNGIARADVAKFMLEELKNNSLVRKSVLVTVH